ncbi:tRNA pseudouridine(13) synthase TruD [bacterium]|nr:tRNA pseudouridine(13) synthase TruD [bacterium]
MSLKLKSRPEDFEVEEQTGFVISDGPFAVYLLTKRSLGTPEAITAIQQRWNLSRQYISYGGLKDKHAVTRQWVTIRKGPKRNLEQDNLSLIYQGQSAQPFTPHDITANRFSLVLRNLNPADMPELLARSELIARDGLPNYFDDQRFGSLGLSGEFIAKPWCLGDYERTLYLAIAEPNPHDRPQDREEKQIVRSLWGQWLACKATLPKSSRRSIITYLCDHPTDFRRAVALVRQDLRSLYLAAFQSHLWNQILAETIREGVATERQYRLRLESGLATFFRELTDEERGSLTSLSLPLPSARLHFDEGDPLIARYERVAEQEGLALREMRVKFPRDSFFSKGERQAVVLPTGLQAISQTDEINTGRAAIRLLFTLPRGSYATILVKRLTAEPADPPALRIDGM